MAGHPRRAQRLHEKPQIRSSRQTSQEESIHEKHPLDARKASKVIFQQEHFRSHHRSQDEPGEALGAPKNGPRERTGLSLIERRGRDAHTRTNGYNICDIMLWCVITQCWRTNQWDNLCYNMVCYFMSCYIMLCYIMLCYVMLCCVILWCVIFCYVIFCYFIW